MGVYGYLWIFLRAQAFLDSVFQNIPVFYIESRALVSARVRSVSDSPILVSIETIFDVLETDSKIFLYHLVTRSRLFSLADPAKGNSLHKGVCLCTCAASSHAPLPNKK